MTEMQPDYEGRVIAGRYRVERLLGQGGMGSVWAGRHLTLNQLVAIKFIHPRLTSSEDALRRFEVEAKAAARLRSLHAARVYDHGVTADSQPYIVMEYLEGETLGQSVRRRGHLPLLELVRVISETARALGAAHEQGILHRDLKPDNIFLATERDAPPFGYVVKVLDFGIAKIAEDDGLGTGTQAGMVLGTPHYMSPEALTASAPVGAAADIWSLGACAYAAACGTMPFYGDAIGDVVLKVCVAPMPVPSKVQPALPKAFDEWFARACARDVSQRFASMKEAEQAILELDAWNQRRREQSLYELGKIAGATELDSLHPPSSRRALLLGGGLAGASVMLALLGNYAYQRTRAAADEAARVAASARAVMDRENERRLREAEQRFWSQQPDAGPPSEDAGVPNQNATQRKKKR
ncbi:MAG TPA: serine/threonine-protein kinase [Polyangiaceae bacterium]|nr:serine/threonine-protein kinase [Polyangiaceae bacterium]